MVKIVQYLDTINEIIDGGMVVKSPYVSALQEARSFTRRDSLTGNKEDGVSHGSWLGAVGYMIVLDHIGNKFNNPEKEDRFKEIKKIAGETNSFTRALIYFSDLSYREIFALYSLRCSFIHDFFLFNINKNQHLTHHFIVTRGKGRIVILPKINWDGNPKNRNYGNITEINLEVLGDLVEKIHELLLSLAVSGKLELNPEITLEYLTYEKTADKRQ